LSLRMGGRLVTCGSTSGVSAETNLMMLFQRQLRITGSFGCSLRNIAESLAKMAQGIRPVLDAVLPLERFAEGLERLESRNVFGKIVVTL
ncbi:MAG: zinc-binding dehydrogenase, partial [Roseococcus sp.]